MGAIAEAMVAYAQPLIDDCDGSIEGMNKAFMLSSVCYNLGRLPEEKRESMISEMQAKFGLNDVEFEEFRQSVLSPMLQRYETMFGGRQLNGFGNSLQSRTRRSSRPTEEATGEEKLRVDRYAPCSCNSGLKYKFCCGKKS